MKDLCWVELGSDDSSVFPEVFAKAEIVAIADKITVKFLNEGITNFGVVFPPEKLLP